MLRTVNIEAINRLCERYKIARLALFGSALRRDFRPESDIDVLVEFLPGANPGLFTLGSIQMELSNIFEREVDLKTPGFLSPYFRQQVVDAAHVLYEQS